jgi:hypothetical protein
VLKRESTEALYRTPQYLTYEYILIGYVQIIVFGNSKIIYLQKCITTDKNKCLPNTLKIYSYGHKTEHNIAMLLASDLAVETSNHLHHRSKYYQFHVV